MSDLLTLEGQKLHAHSEVPPFLNMHPKKQDVSQIHLNRTRITSPFPYLQSSVFSPMTTLYSSPIKIVSFPLLQGGIRDLFPHHLLTWLPLWINSLSTATLRVPAIGFTACLTNELGLVTLWPLPQRRFSNMMCSVASAMSNASWPREL